MSRVRLVVFDMDGVIFRGRNFWLDLHRAYGTEREALELADAYLVADYEYLSRRTAQVLWKGKAGSVLLDMVARRRYHPAAASVFQQLRRAGVVTAIVSSGPVQLAERAQRDLGVDEIRANYVEIVDGRLSGRVEIAVLDSEKGSVIPSILEKYDVKRDETAAVGDSVSDLDMFRYVGMTIAYNSTSPDLSAAADYVLAEGELDLIPGLIADPAAGPVVDVDLDERADGES